MGVRPALPLPLERRRPAAVPRAAAGGRAGLAARGRGVPRGPTALRVRRRRRPLRCSPRCRPTCSRTARSSPPTSASRCFFLLAVVAFSRLLDRPRWPWLLACGLAVGAAFATKFSGPILALVLVLLALAAPGALRLGRRAALLAAIAALALAVLWAAYGFRHALSTDPAVREAGRVSLEQPVGGAGLRAVVAAANAGLLPEDYARGLVFVMTHSEARTTFLLGRLSDRGFPQYFLVTLPAEDAAAAAAADARGARAGAAARESGGAVRLGAGRGLPRPDLHARPADRPPAPAAGLPVPVPGRGRGRGVARDVAPAGGRRARPAARRLVRRRHAAEPPSSPRLLQRDRRRAGERLAAPGRLEPRLGAGPEAARRVAAGEPGRAARAVVLRQRRPRLLRPRCARRFPATRPRTRRT